jgi:hypothetical protein
MSDAPEPPSKRLQELLGSLSAVVAPITLISALLFYFGYVYTTTEYAYFGLDVDTIGLSAQEFVMRSPPPLLTPLIFASLLGTAVTLLHGAIKRRVAAARRTAPWRLTRHRRSASACRRAGWILMAAGGVMVVSYAWLGPLLPTYSLVTPLVLAVGAAVALYGVRLDGLLDRPHHATVSIALCVVATIGLFWATATLAEYIGRASAITLGEQLTTTRPGVVLDTKERLFLPSTSVTEEVLPATEGQTYRYRYRNMRLLIQGQGRLFLVPDPWSEDSPTLVVPLDDVRLQFQTG